jgi:S-disulfanyl-L-cysteine oxidoreductase SoxD
MNRSRFGAGSGAAICLLAVAAKLTAQADLTVWDGIFTEEQAERGAQLYAEHCAQCHGEALGGVEAAPALSGVDFYGKWDGETVAALFDRIRVSMPPNTPGALSRAQNADLIAHLLQVGGYPAGSTPLAAQAGVLAQIRLAIYKP